MLPLPLFASFIFSGTMEILVPIILGLYISRRFGGSWKVFLIGCAMFAVSMIRIPLNTYGSNFIAQNFLGPNLMILLIAFPSLTAGLFEEAVRFAAFKLWIKDHRFEEGLMYGAGHGGFESMALVGLSVLSTGIIASFFPETLPPGQLELLSVLPAYLPLVGLYERLMAITIQIGLSIVILQTFIQKTYMYLLAAILLHFAINFLSIYALQYGIVWAELTTTIFALLLATYIWRMVQRTRDESKSGVEKVPL